MKFAHFRSAPECVLSGEISAACVCVCEMATTKAKFNALQFLEPHEIDLQIFRTHKVAEEEAWTNFAFRVCFAAKLIFGARNESGLGESHDRELFNTRFNEDRFLVPKLSCDQQLQ